jgi:hypothetical protein
MIPEEDPQPSGSVMKAGSLSPVSPSKFLSSGSGSGSKADKRWSMTTSGWLPPNTTYKPGTFTSEVKQIVALPTSSANNGESGDGAHNQAPAIRYDATKVHVVRVMQSFTGSLSGQLSIEVDFPFFA